MTEPKSESDHEKAQNALIKFLPKLGYVEIEKEKRFKKCKTEQGIKEHYDLDIHAKRNDKLYDFELDGGYHETKSRGWRDVNRNRYFRSLGYTIIRLRTIWIRPNKYFQMQDLINEIEHCDTKEMQDFYCQTPAQKKWIPKKK